MNSAVIWYDLTNALIDNFLKILSIPAQLFTCNFVIRKIFFAVLLNQKAKLDASGDAKINSDN